jgi:DNA-binding transcriptional LysR family regulator
LYIKQMTGNPLNLRRLGYFVAVAEELHFGRAARRVGIAQPALSQQIGKLEAELSVLLFERTKRSVRLTEAGRALVGEGRELLARSNQITSRLLRVSEGKVGCLRVGFVASGAYDILPPIVRRFRRAFPDVQIEVDECGLEFPVERLSSGALDLAVVRGPVNRTDFRIETLLREPLCAVVPCGHRLAARRRIALGSLRDETFILFPRHRAPEFHDQITGMCRAAGFVPNVRQDAAEWQLLVSLVAAGFGVTLAPASVRFMPRRGVQYLAISPCASFAQLDLVFSQLSTSPAAERFARIARQMGLERMAKLNSSSRRRD